MLNADLAMTIRVPNVQVKSAFITISAVDPNICYHIVKTNCLFVGLFLHFQYAHVCRDTLEMHWVIVCAVNVKVMWNVQTVVPALIIHALTHASDNVVQMLSAKLSDTLPSANAQEATRVMLHHHVFDNHEHTMGHSHDIIRKSEQRHDTKTQTSTPNETYTFY